jgi:hypothetical protein
MTTDNAVFPEDRERELLAGFVDPQRVLGHDERKTAAKRLRVRVAAVELATGTDARRVSCAQIAAKVGMSERSMSRWFPVHEAIFAFPPPELASAFVAVALRAQTWPEVPGHLRPLFEALEDNPIGRTYMAGLCKLHGDNRGLRAADGYFACELRRLLDVNIDRAGTRSVALIGYFTEGIRSAFEDWAGSPEDSLLVMVDAVAELILKPPEWPSVT